jgi:hypothetical protein
MKIIANEILIKRNNRLGQILSIAALVILGIGMFFSFKDTSNGTYMTFSFAALIVGFIVFQIGNFFLNRWGKSPRPDELISASLKGLDDKYTLYHYSTDIPHLLAGPAGIMALMPYSQGGTITYDAQKKDWKQHGGNFFLKAFSQEGLGKPVSEAQFNKEELDRYLTKIGIKPDQAKTSALLVFTNEKAEIKGEGSPVPFVVSSKIKDYLRKQAKEINFDSEPIIEILNKNIKLK